MNQIKDLLFFVDPSLRYAKREIDVVEEYAQDCWNITPQKIFNSLDIFAFAHALGWVGKAVLLRSYGLCWLISILWELTEIVFYHILPNFAECFWDSWILDVCICNGGGIWLGIKIAEFLEVRKYKWESIKDIDSVSGKLRRAAMQFSPHSWFAVSWIDPQSSPHRVFKLWILTMLFLVVELNTFFFKHFFVFDSNHFLCWGRITFIERFFKKSFQNLIVSFFLLFLHKSLKFFKKNFSHLSYRCTFNSTILCLHNRYDG